MGKYPELPPTYIEYLLDLDRRLIWHPYTQAYDYRERNPILVVYGEGMKVYDGYGNWYYDAITSWWSAIFGHRHPKIMEAIRQQTEKLDHIHFAGFTHENAIVLAEKLLSYAPPYITRIFYSDDGSTAVEVALKMAFQYWQNKGKPEKKYFVHLENSYHGDTVGAMSVGGIPVYHELFGQLCFPAFSIPSPYCYRCPMGKDQLTCRSDCLQPLEGLLEAKEAEIVAVIVEPLIQAAAGILVYPEKYLKRLGEMIKGKEVLLIADEVAVGVGRTGKFFAFEWGKLEPDLICIAKGLTGGSLPLAATLASEEIFQTFYAPYEEMKAFQHGHTYTANPICTAAGRAVLELLEEEAPLEHAPAVEERLRTGLEQLRDISIVGDVRGKGFIGAVELVEEPSSKKNFSWKRRMGWRVYLAGLKYNIILRPLGDVIYFYLPLNVNLGELDNMIERAYEAIKEVSKEELK